MCPEVKGGIGKVVGEFRGADYNGGVGFGFGFRFGLGR